ncbi:MAG: hypothetical protein ACFFCQ_15870 [Promethearchaeota archaeon]
MNVIAHVLVTWVLVELFNLSEYEMILAVLFGVVIDLDHLVKVPIYVKENGLKVVRHWNWRTGLQEPVSLLWIIPISFFLQTWVPIFFFLMHLSLDYLMSYEKRPFYPYNAFIINDKGNFTSDSLLGILVSVISLSALIFLVVW